MDSNPAVKLATLAAVASVAAEAALAALDDALDRARAANDAVLAVCLENARAAFDNGGDVRAAMAPADEADEAYAALWKARDAAFKVAWQAKSAALEARLPAK